jgi:hypothetical protein
MLKNVAGILLVFMLTTLAWLVLGGTIAFRTATQDGVLHERVGDLWGDSQHQRAPMVSYEVRVPVEKPVKEAKRRSAEAAAPAQAQQQQPAVEEKIEIEEVPLDSSQIEVDLDLEHRQKGLLWYSTYNVGFSGRYTFTNHTPEARDFVVGYSFPTQGATYDDFRFLIDGVEATNLDVDSATLRRTVRVAAGKQATIEVGYRSRGLDRWWYEFGSNVNQVKNFALTVHTDFDDLDFPPNTISPTAKVKEDRGWRLDWRYTNLLSGVNIGVELPKKLNPGPWASQISFFAPVSLFFFFFLLFMFSNLQGVKLHPMHYMFIGAGFFSYHLLLAYLVDHVAIHTAFAICSVVSLALVISYMRLVVGNRFAITQVGISQFVYLVLFSYTFFFEKYTGLAVTCLSIATLFVVMQLTGRLDWARLFAGERGGPDAQLPAPPVPVSADAGAPEWSASGRTS